MFHHKCRSYCQDPIRPNCPVCLWVLREDSASMKGWWEKLEVDWCPFLCIEIPSWCTGHRSSSTLRIDHRCCCSIIQQLFLNFTWTLFIREVVPFTCLQLPMVYRGKFSPVSLDFRARKGSRNRPRFSELAVDFDRMEWFSIVIPRASS